VRRVSMDIVDAHMHLGKDVVFNIDYSEADLLQAMGANGIAAALVQPQPGASDPVEQHERVAAMAKAHPGKVYGIASFNPFIDEKTYVKQIDWAIKTLGFKGIKIHTNGHCISPTHPAARKVFRLASELGVVVMIHTGAGIPNSVPSLCIPAAREYPDLPIILAHAGGGILGMDAIVAANECRNVYLECSWTTSFELKGMVDSVGAEKIMFGSDILENVSCELHKFRSVGISDGQLEWCLGKTARKVFSI
jgi:hypothetical protein